MCGIAGIISSFGRSLDLDRAPGSMATALEHLAHRGPDASGIMVTKDKTAIFGHRRLAIIDLSPKANQPMLIKEKGIYITYNGEIYNYKELKEELEKEGERFFSSSDTEVLLRGYAVWGFDELLERINGMFGFALYDSKKKVSYLARDRVGIKPLYYALNSGILYFASEVRALLDIWPGKRSLDPAALSLYLTLKFTPSPTTLFAGIKRLEPGIYARFQADGAMHIHHYWSPFNKDSWSFSPTSVVNQIDTDLTDSVRRRMVSDVPVAAFLSGGIDSSLIIAKLNQLNIKQPTTYSIGYKDYEQFNELKFSRMVADRYPINYREVLTDAKETENILLDDQLILDEPISDWVWVPLYVLSRKARDDGFKVILLGEGSDEQFVGYDSMMSLMKEQLTWQRLIGHIPGLAKLLFAAARPFMKNAVHGHRTFDLIRRMASGDPLYIGSSIAYRETQKHQVAGRNLQQHIDRAAQSPPDPGETSPFTSGYLRALHARFDRSAPDPFDLVNRICYIEIYTKMIEILLHRVDRITMLNSIEARVPFLDHTLVEHTFRIPGSMKLQGNTQKAVLKKIAQNYLPGEIINRKKMGFSFPFKEWLQGPLGDMVASTFSTSNLCRDEFINGAFCLRMLSEHRRGKIDHASQIWTTYTLCRWYDKWIS